MAVDLEGRPYILMRANLWFDGDTSNPSVGDLCRLLMWITEDMARSVQVCKKSEMHGLFFLLLLLVSFFLTADSLHWLHVCHGHERLDEEKLFNASILSVDAHDSERRSCEV